MPPVSKSVRKPCTEVFKSTQPITFLDSIIRNSKFDAPRVLDGSILKKASGIQSNLPPFATAGLPDKKAGLRYDPGFCKRECDANCYLYSINSSKFPRGQDKWDALEEIDLPLTRQNSFQKIIDKITGSESPREKGKHKLIRAIVDVAEGDGLTYAGKKKPEVNDCDGYLIAFYVNYLNSSDWDYHFLRQDSRPPDNFETWSNKGEWRLPVSQSDDKGDRITNPEGAKFYHPHDENECKYEFIGYFIAPKGGLGSKE